MNQEKIMSQAEDQWLDDLNDAHWEQELAALQAQQLKELHEQEEEEMFMQWQAATYAY